MKQFTFCPWTTEEKEFRNHESFDVEEYIQGRTWNKVEWFVGGGQ